MKQNRIKTSHTPLEILMAPRCDTCGGQTRFVGLEADPHKPTADLCTYECVVCDHSQVATVERINGQARTA